MVISSFAPGAAATKYWKACECPSMGPAAPPPSCLPSPSPGVPPQPLLERALGVDGDRPQALGELDLLLGPHALARERPRHPVLLGDLADDRPPPGARGGETERGGHRRLADAALAGHIQHRPIPQQRFHRSHLRKNGGN